MWAPGGSIGIVRRKSSADIAYRVAAAMALAALATLPSAVPGSGVATAATSKSATRIVFERFDPRLGTFRIYTINPDGSGLRAITDPPARGADGQPAVSPDGSQVAFRRVFNIGRRSKRTDVLVAEIDGGGVRNLTRTSCTRACLGNGEPDWSPDGQQIAFGRAIGPVPRNGPPPIVGLFIMDADGSNVRRLTQLTPNSGTEDHTPSWSPDGETIAFMRSNNTIKPVHASAIYTIDPDGGEPTRIRKMPRKWPGAGAEPDWSPDGRRLLFDTYCFFGSCGQPRSGAELFTIRSDGTDRRRLTDLPGNSYDGNWSPNGRKIVFSRHCGVAPLADLYVMRRNGSHIRRLIHAPWRNNHNTDWALTPR